mmetsp:Transcript_27452/g.71886  ORF Transcript_27452/g.71886 Transcript_27452/m.71886 type:complete len:202 (+) Transcript_27452:1448-2053(+)
MVSFMLGSRSGMSSVSSRLQRALTAVTPSSSSTSGPGPSGSTSPPSSGLSGFFSVHLTQKLHGPSQSAPPSIFFFHEHHGALMSSNRNASDTQPLFCLPSYSKLSTQFSGRRNLPSHGMSPSSVSRACCSSCASKPMTFEASPPISTASHTLSSLSAFFSGSVDPKISLKRPSKCLMQSSVGLGSSPSCALLHGVTIWVDM